MLLRRTLPEHHPFAHSLQAVAMTVPVNTFACMQSGEDYPGRRSQHQTSLQDIPCALPGQTNKSEAAIRRKSGCVAELVHLLDHQKKQLTKVKLQLSKQMTQNNILLSSCDAQHQAQLSELAARHSSQLSKLTAQHETCLSELTTQLQTAHSDKQSAAMELDSLLGEHEALMIKDEHTRANHAELDQQLQKLKSQDKQQQQQMQLALDANRYNLACLQTAIGHRAELDQKLATASQAGRQASENAAELSNQLCLLTDDHARTVGLLDAAVADCGKLSKELQQAEAAHAHEVKAHEQTRCAAQRTDAQLQDLGDFYRYQAQTQADAKDDILFVLQEEADAQHHFHADFQSMDRQIVSLHAKCRQQKQVMKDSAETLSRSAASLAKSASDNSRLQDSIAQLHRQISQLQGQLVITRQQVAAQEGNHKLKSDSLESDKAAWTEDMHKLEDEVLRLADLLQTAEATQVQQHQQLQQQLQQQLSEHTQDRSVLLQRLSKAESQFRKLLETSAARGCKHEREVASLKGQLQSAEQQLTLASQQHQQQLQHQLQRQSEQSRRTEAELHLKLSESASQCSQLRAEQDSLHVHLGKLRELAVSRQITPDAIFSMFADPVTPAAAGSGSSEDPSAATSSAPQMPFATTAKAPSHSPAASASTPPVTADETTAGKSITSQAATAGTPTSTLVATASGPVPTAVHQTQPLSIVDVTKPAQGSAWEAELRLPAAEPRIINDSSSDFGAHLVKRSEEMQGQLTNHMCCA